MKDVIYLDHNATTPCDARVVEAMLPYFTTTFANTSSRSHHPGREAFMALEDARRRVARALGARSSTEIVFTSGATEANNLALFGAAAALENGSRRTLVTQRTEHPAVLAPLELLASRGWKLELIGVDHEGRIRLDELDTALNGEVALLSLMLANNETGSLQPVAEAAALARSRGVVVHCDAAQAVGKIPVNLHTSGVDYLSLSAHKLYGPKGVGALYCARSAPRLHPLVHGGGQEQGLRSGTVNLPGVVGLARALELALESLGAETARLAALRDRLEERILTEFEGAVINGSPAHRLPGTSNLSFPGVDGEALRASLPDLAVSSGSACTSGRPEPSSVLQAMGVSKALAAASLRLGLGRFTSASEVDMAARRIAEEARRLRSSRQRC